MIRDVTVAQTVCGGEAVYADRALVPRPAEGNNSVGAAIRA